MCNQCIETVKKWFPLLPEDQYGELLVSGTAFPMGDPEYIAAQVEELAKHSDGTLDSALAYAHEQFRAEAARTFSARATDG